VVVNNSIKVGPLVFLL